MQSFTFHKSERLKSRKTISLLFQKGRTIRKYPLRIRWVCIENEVNQPVQSTFSIPKRLVPKAVNRNRIKRIIREAYRLNKHILYDALDGNKQQYALMFIYQDRVIPNYKEIALLMEQTIPEIAKALNQYQPSRSSTRLKK